MDKALVEMSIGALLHDIGKISQRAKGHLSAQSERMKSFICPTGEHGRHTHLHAAHTNEFFEDIGAWLPHKLDGSRVANLASYHHRPDTPEQTIIQQADWLSAGQDRREAEEEEARPYRSARLQSVFASVSMGGKAAEPELRSVPIATQTLDEQVFPRANFDSDSVEKQYEELFKSLRSHLGGLREAPHGLFLERLRWIFGLYSWCVPSSLREAGDVSLFDHSLTTAAFAAALHQYHTETNTMDQAAIRDWHSKKFRIVTGDLHGIQSYIFHFALERPTGASKRLRARSFYLGLLTQLASHLILTDLGLPCFSRIMDAGGRFALLVANTEKTLACLGQVERDIHTWFLRTYHGLLNLNLSYDLELSGSDFALESFVGMSRRIARSAEMSKLNPFHARLRSASGWDRGAICQPFGTREYDEAEADFFSRLGQILPEAKVLLISTPDHPPAGRLTDQSAGRDFLRPFDRLVVNLETTYPSSLRDLQSVVQLIPSWGQEDARSVVSGQYLANYIPRQSERDRHRYTQTGISEWLKRAEADTEEEPLVFREGHPKTFAHLAVDSLFAKSDGNTKGSPMLAVLKADVDRLGFIFSRGLGSRLSIGRYATLSRQMDLFFRGYLTYLLVAPPAEHLDFRNIYTVYSGGDDLLFVGPWWTMFEFASYLRKALHRYVAENGQITISAGLATMRPRYPLSQVVVQADNLLDQAKNAGRNRIAVFGSILSWQDFEQALEDSQFLDQAMNEGVAGIRVARGFVYRLLKYHEMFRDLQNVSNRKWRSHLTYDIARNVQRVPSDQKGKPAGLERIEAMTSLTTDQSVMERLRVSATCCLYMNRGGDI